MRWIALVVFGIVGCSHTQTTEIVIKTMACEIRISTAATSKDKKEENICERFQTIKPY